MYLRYRRERGVAARRRLQALWLVHTGEGVAEAAKQAGVGQRTVERWLGWYRQEGLDRVLERVPGCGGKGSQPKLGREQLEQLAGSGTFRTYWEAADWVRSRYGVTYSYNGIWGLLSRLRIHPKVPRPVAEQADHGRRRRSKRGARRVASSCWSGNRCSGALLRRDATGTERVTHAGYWLVEESSLYSGCSYGINGRISCWQLTHFVAPSGGSGWSG